MDFYCFCCLSCFTFPELQSVVWYLSSEKLSAIIFLFKYFSHFPFSFWDSSYTYTILFYIVHGCLMSGLLFSSLSSSFHPVLYPFVNCVVLWFLMDLANKGNRRSRSRKSRKPGIYSRDTVSGEHGLHWLCSSLESNLGFLWLLLLFASWGLEVLPIHSPSFLSLS